MAEPTISKPVLMSLLTTVFLDFLGFSMILPYLFFFAQSLGGTTFVYGIIVASYAAEQFLFSPVLGRLSDRYGRRRILIITLIGSGASYIVFGLSNVLWLLLISRMLAGAFSGTYPIAQAYVADATNKQSRLKYMGFLGGAYGLGYVLGPLIGGTMSRFYGFAAPSFLAATLASANALFCYFRLPESRSTSIRTEGVEHFSLSSLKRAVERAELGLLLLLNFASTLAFVFLIVILPPWLEAIFRFGAFETGLIFFYGGAVSIATVVVLVPRLSKKLPPATLVIIGLAIVSVNYLGLSLVSQASFTSLIFGFVMAGLLAFAFSIIGPGTNTLISINAGTEEQGRTLGIAQSTASLARAVAPTLATILFVFGYSFGMIGLAFFIAAIVNLAALPLMLLFRRANYPGTSIIDVDIEVEHPIAVKVTNPRALSPRPDSTSQ